MGEDNALYVVVGFGVGAIFGTVYIDKVGNGQLERITQEQPVLETKNVLGNSLLEKFFVIRSDTLYLQVDGKPINYFTQTR